MIGHGWMAELAGFSPVVTGSLIAAVWQGVLLAAVAGLALRLLPKTPAAVRFAIWFGVFLVVTALPVIALWPHGGGAVGPESHNAWLTLDLRWSLAIAAMWLVASLVRAVTLVAAAFRVRALWKRARPVETGSFADPTHGDEAAMNGAPGAGRRAQVCVSDEVDRPTVIGFFSPKILIPDWLLEKLTPAELEQVVLHESGHLGRADDWMNLLQKVALVLFPLNPALAWVERRLCFERELAVDERVLEAFSGKPGAARAYAECLTTLAEYRLGRRGFALALGALGRESELGRRIGRILRRGEGMRPLHSRLVFGGAMLGLLVAATGFERCPQVIRFANTGLRSVADTQASIPTHGDTTAMNGAPGAGAVRAVDVIYKLPQKNEINNLSHVSHQESSVASSAGYSQSLRTQDGDAVQRTVDKSGDRSARMVQTSAAIFGGRDRTQTISDVRPAEPAAGVTEWVAVTTWQDGLATQMLLTTARTTEVKQDMPSEAGPRYAAVPVRGGWLVFQL